MASITAQPLIIEAISKTFIPTIFFLAVLAGRGQQKVMATLNQTR